jgi:hypothetical protein
MIASSSTRSRLDTIDQTLDFTKASPIDIGQLIEMIRLVSEGARLMN